MSAEGGSRPPRDAGTFQTGAVLLLSLCHFVHDVYSSFLSPLLPLLIQKLSMSLTQAGLLSTVMQLPALINPWIRYCRRLRPAPRQRRSAGPRPPAAGFHPGVPSATQL